MKKLTLVLTMLFFVTISFAQIRRDVPANSTDTIPRTSKKEMMDELDLTKDQRSRWKQIQHDNKAQREAIMNNDSLSTEDKKMRLKELHKETNKSINAILTNEQIQKMQQIKEENKAAKVNNANNTNNTMQDPNQ